MTELTGMTPQELSDWCKAQGMPAFRGKQIFRWIHQGADFDAMTNLPAAMRAQLKEIAVAQPVSIIDERKSQIDDTVKFLFGLKDGNCVEGVLMHYHHGYTLCISTQVGCRMGCKFCASTLEGCVRSLTAGEMLGEVLAANRYLDGKDRVHNIVLMGSGEPLDNYDNVCRFLRLLREEDGVNIGLRNVSLSTCRRCTSSRRRTCRSRCRCRSMRRTTRFAARPCPSPTPTRWTSCLPLAGITSTRPGGASSSSTHWWAA